ncbi:hypothetical protein RJ641_025607 [Dillenia turbinata]|uniref:Uncharacterized protein n=1 Tax=Dillenia turbinata TaxID=194707 RepID=A0AAN8ZT92_9MAGN
MTSGTLRRRLHHGDIDGRRRENLEISELDCLNEPLLQNRVCDDDRRSESYCGTCVGMHGWRSLGRGKKEVAMVVATRAPVATEAVAREGAAVVATAAVVTWRHNSKSPLVYIATIVLGPGSLIGWLLPFSSASQIGQHKMIQPSLSRLQGQFVHRPSSFPQPIPLDPTPDYPEASSHEVRLENLRQRLEIPFDGSSVEHQDFRIGFKDRLEGIMSIVVQGNAHRLRPWCWMQNRVAENRKQNGTEFLSGNMSIIV